MIALMIVLGLMFYQNTHVYKSDIIKYENGRNYVACNDADQKCPEVSVKSLKDISETKVGLQPKKPEPQSRISLPIEEINSTLNKIRDQRSNRDNKLGMSFIQAGLKGVGDEKDKDREPDKKEEPGLSDMENNSKDIATVYSIPLEKILIPAETPSVLLDKPFAIKPHAYYKPENEEILMARLEDEGKEERMDNAMGAIETKEIHFNFNENEIYPDVSGMEQIKQINEKYKNQRIRVTGYGLDENEAVTLVMQVLEQIDESILIEDVSTISDKEKRYVSIEVLNEI